MSEEHDGEFLPLPFFPWERRPSHVPIETEEAATALYLSEGVIADAAARLRCDPLRLVRTINRSPRLKRLHAELASLLNDRVHAEYKRAFEAEDDRRREWAASKVALTRQFQDHPLAPNSNAQSSLPTPNSVGRIVISWEEAPLIEHRVDDVSSDGGVE
jgi:hypothetical protein